MPAKVSGNAALFALDHLPVARHNMGMGVLTHFDADMFAAHLMSDRACSAGTSEGVENEVGNVT